MDYIQLILGALVGTVFGVIVGVIIGTYIKYPDKQVIKSTHTDLASHPSQNKLKLKEEKLEITKSRIKTGEVKFYKEIVEEEKTVTVPLEHEELVIETFEVHGDEKKRKDVIRITLNKEELVVTKHPKKVSEVSISKNCITEMKQIKETLKKEQACYEVIGIADVKNEDLLEDVQRIH
ncbi:YsnF/AvaK domain-containing protein [Ammoniphilus sp. 3BR4]|uniref:YsnF/AvaK domain-containing protein n=1 Tax=Ammoniphilus sp. 3BR4 TaxID=3158265 RepID=UPI0034661E3C